MITDARFEDLRDHIVAAGFKDDIDFYENKCFCEGPRSFGAEAVWVILNSGMKNQVAVLISQRIQTAISDGVPIGGVFGHKGKVKAIEFILENQERLYVEFQSAPDRVAYLETLPWIGPITKWHLAKNLGIDVAKPDRWLIRLADAEETTPQTLCERLAGPAGLRVATVDYVLWRAGNLGLLHELKVQP